MKNKSEDEFIESKFGVKKEWYSNREWVVLKELASFQEGWIDIKYLDLRLVEIYKFDYYKKKK